MLQVVIPMAGLGSRFSQYGFSKNKYLLPLDLNLVSMIEYAILSLAITVPCKYIFILRDNIADVARLLQTICETNSLTYNIVTITELTEGPASTVYEARHVLNPDDELIVSNSDQVLSWDFNAFMTKCKQFDGCVLTYKPDYEITLNQPDKHSFIHLNDAGTVDECREKIALSDKALVGVHYFKTAQQFLDAYKYMVATNLRAPNGEFYLSLAYQAMIQTTLSVGYHDLQYSQGERFYPVGEPNDYFKYLYERGGYTHNVKPLHSAHLESHEAVIYKANSLTVTYTNIAPNTHFKNNGLILFIRGSAQLHSTNQTIKQDTLTNDDLFSDETEACEIVSIYLNNATGQKRTWDVADFTRGWFIGDFQPSIIKTSEFEVAKLSHKKNEKWGFHYHSLATEINVLLKGSMTINGMDVSTNSIFICDKNQVACPIFNEDCDILCIKVPSKPDDKYII